MVARPTVRQEGVADFEAMHRSVARFVTVRQESAARRRFSQLTGRQGFLPSVDLATDSFASRKLVVACDMSPDRVRRVGWVSIIPKPCALVCRCIAEGPAHFAVSVDYFPIAFGTSPGTASTVVGFGDTTEESSFVGIKKTAESQHGTSQGAASTIVGFGDTTEESSFVGIKKAAEGQHDDGCDLHD